MNITKIALAAAISVASCFAATASAAPPLCKQSAVYVAGLAWHAEGDGYRTFTPGLAGECNGWSAGAYLNSINKMSLHVDRRFDVYGPVGVRVGAVSGYIEGRILPSAAVSVMLHNIEALIIPEVRYDQYYTPWTVGVRIKFDISAR